METLRKQFRGIAPFFFVRDVCKSAEYYRDVFGFEYELLWGEPPCFCMPMREGCVVMLSEVDEPALVRPNGVQTEAWDAYIWVEDADALFQELKGKGAQVKYEPIDRPYYDMREFAVQDLDGYVLAFGSEKQFGPAAGT